LIVAKAFEDSIPIVIPGLTRNPVSFQFVGILDDGSRTGMPG
jgi:hypothetical protein